MRIVELLSSEFETDLITSAEQEYFWSSRGKMFLKMRDVCSFFSGIFLNRISRFQRVLMLLRVDTENTPKSSRGCSYYLRLTPKHETPLSFITTPVIKPRISTSFYLFHLSRCLPVV